MDPATIIIIFLLSGIFLALTWWFWLTILILIYIGIIEIFGINHR